MQKLAQKGLVPLLLVLELPLLHEPSVAVLKQHFLGGHQVFHLFGLVLQLLLLALGEVFLVGFGLLLGLVQFGVGGRF